MPTDPLVVGAKAALGDLSNTLLARKGDLLVQLATLNAQAAAMQDEINTIDHQVGAFGTVTGFSDPAIRTMIDAVQKALTPPPAPPATTPPTPAAPPATTTPAPAPSPPPAAPPATPPATTPPPTTTPPSAPPTV